MIEDTDLLDLRPVLCELVLVRHDDYCSYNNFSKNNTQRLYKRVYSGDMKKKVKTRWGGHLDVDV
jgi:hypothetical protein